MTACKNVISAPDCPLHGMHVIFTDTEVSTSRAYYHECQDRSPAQAVIQWTTSGCGFIKCEDGIYHEVPPGHAFITEMPSLTVYGYPPEATQAYAFQYLSVRGQLSYAMAKAFRTKYGPVFHLSAHPGSLSLFRELVQRFEVRSFQDRYEESDMLYHCFSVLMRDAAQSASRRDPIARCYEKIQNHYRDTFNVNELADEVGISREHLARRFKARYGQSPSRMLQEIRMREARVLVASGNADLHTIALATGFREARTLKRLLRKPQSLA